MQLHPKQIFRLFLISSSLWLCSAGCEIETDYSVRADYYYLNNSASDIVIRRYSAGQGPTMTLLEELSIKSKAELKVSTEDIGPENINCEDFMPHLASDSLSIVYNNGTVSSFNLADPGNDNPMPIGNYTSQKISRNYCEFRFTIN